MAQNLYQKIVIKVVPADTSNDDIIKYCQNFGELTEINDTAKSANGGPRTVFLCFQNKEMATAFMNGRPHTIKGRPMEVMRGYPREMEVSQKDQQVSRILVRPVNSTDRNRIGADQIRKYFQSQQFGPIFEVTKKNIEGDFFVDYVDYDSVDKVLLGGNQHSVAGVKVHVEKDQSNYWIRASCMEPEMSVKDLCGIISNQSQHWVATEDVIFCPGDGLSQPNGAIIKQHKRTSIHEANARFLANMWTINAFNISDPVRFEAVRSVSAPQQLCTYFQNGPCPYESVPCNWEHVTCPLGLSCRAEQCRLGHPSGRDIYPPPLSEDDDRFRFRTKISNLPDNVKEIDLARSLLKLQHCRSIKIIRSATLVYAYLLGQKSEKQARKRVYKWHDKLYENQRVECQLEMYDRRCDTTDEEEATLISSYSELSREVSNGNDDDVESIVESQAGDKSTFLQSQEMIDAPGRPDGLSDDYVWTGEKLSPENHLGQADVYIVINRKNSKRAVVKLYKATDRDDFRRRVKSEIIALRRLNCRDVENISKLLDTNVDPDQDNDKKLWAMMQLIGGCTLHDYKRDVASVPLGKIVEIIRQLLTIIKAIHAEGVVHRDLKPANVMIDPKTGILTVIDFGMTFNQSHELTDPLVNPDEQGTSIGIEMANKFYRPPQMNGHLHNSNEECVRQQRRSPRVDASMIGALFFWLMTGIVPYTAQERGKRDFYNDQNCQNLIKQAVYRAVAGDQKLTKKLTDRLNRIFEKTFAEYDKQWTVDALEERMEMFEEDLREANGYNVEEEQHGQSSELSSDETPSEHRSVSSRPSPIPFPSLLETPAQTYANVSRSTSTIPKNTTDSLAATRNTRIGAQSPTHAPTSLEDDWITKQPSKTHRKKK